MRQVSIVHKKEAPGRSRGFAIPASRVVETRMKSVKPIAETRGKIVIANGFMLKFLQFGTGITSEGYLLKCPHLLLS